MIGSRVIQTDFVQKGFYGESNKLREPSAEEFFVDSVQKGFH